MFFRVNVNASVQKQLKNFLCFFKSKQGCWCNHSQSSGGNISHLCKSFLIKTKTPVFNHLVQESPPSCPWMVVDCLDQTVCTLSPPLLNMLYQQKEQKSDERWTLCPRGTGKVTIWKWRICHCVSVGVYENHWLYKRNGSRECNVTYKKTSYFWLQPNKVNPVAIFSKYGCLHVGTKHHQ